MKRAWNYVVTMWQPASIFTVGVLFVIFLFTFRLGTLVHGTAALETITAKSSASLQAIFDNPLNAPYKLLQYGVNFIHSGIAFDRIVSGLVAAISIGLFYYVARRFTTKTTALLTTILYATNSALLHIGRTAVPLSMFLVLFMLFAGGFYMRFGRHTKTAWLLSAAVLLLALYTPGLIYFVVPASIWQIKAFRRHYDMPKRGRLILLIVCMALVLSPLIFGFVKAPSLLRDYFLLPSTFPHVLTFVKNFLAVPFSWFFWAPRNPLFRLGRQPILDIFTGTLFVLGCIQLIRRYKLDRFFLIIGIFAIATLLTAISGEFENSMVLLPFIYLLVAIGMGYLFEQWKDVFPLNPLARWVSLVVMLLAVLVSVNFQTRRYFIAWPNNSVTKTVFTNQ
jgi:4-amino-4-deoxy-L-arabinose transferase-like glycosyltransferase